MRDGLEPGLPFVDNFETFYKKTMKERLWSTKTSPYFRSRKLRLSLFEISRSTFGKYRQFLQIFETDRKTGTTCSVIFYITFDFGKRAMGLTAMDLGSY